MPSYSQSDRLTPNQWVVAGSVFGALVLASLALGFSAGRAAGPGKPPATPVGEKPKAKTTPVAEKPERVEEPPPPPKKFAPKTVPIKRPVPTPEPEKPEPEMKKEPEPEPKKVEPMPEPKQVEPKKTEVAKKEPPKKDPNVPAGAVTYTSHIQKIVQMKCVVCHGEGSVKGKLSMKTLALMTKGGSGGAGVVPGKPDESTVWMRIDDGTMPPSDKEQLTDAEKKMIHDWITSGAKEK
ncbi:MAG TPA: c-type cytochrome domain-containing protein [Gemmataceae bacterium]|nr:c-type cytochrome domain-containing protein [Gemmataceae bacterium]